jgi:hypothetical protein
VASALVLTPVPALTLLSLLASWPQPWFKHFSELSRHQNVGEIGLRMLHLYFKIKPTEFGKIKWGRGIPHMYMLLFCAFFLFT